MPWKLFVTMLLVARPLLAEEDCPSYPDIVTPLVESGDIEQLRSIFHLLNGRDQNVVTPYAMFSIESSVAADTHLMKQLVSLSKPLLKKINATDAWPENNNSPHPFGKVCEKDFTGELVCSDSSQEFHRNYNPFNTHHAGIRYVYNCKTLLVKSCFKETCSYNPDLPVMTSEMRNVFVPKENFVMADGSAIADRLEEGEGVYLVKDASKMAVRECFARQVFFHPSKDDCFNSTLFFSLPEVLSMGGAVKDRDAPWYEYMVAKADFFVLFS